MFSKRFLQINERNVKSLKTGTETQCVRSAGAKISEVTLFYIYRLLVIELHILVSNGPIMLILAAYL